jgi:hypothetical protein
MRPWKEKFFPEKETFKIVPIWLRLYSLLINYRLPSTFKSIGNKLGKYVKTSEATLKGRYTSYLRICIEMDVSGALLEAIRLEFRDEEWIQSIDYEKIPFRCRIFHEHGHLFKDFPLNKKQEAENTKIQQDEDGFIKLNHKNRANKKPSKAPMGSKPKARTRMEGRDKTNKGEEGGKEKEKSKEAKEQAPNENTNIPSNNMEQGDSATPMEGETRDSNTPMHEANGDAEMTPSEVGMEESDLRYYGKGRHRFPKHTGAMEKAGHRQCTSGETRLYPIPIHPQGGRKIQRAQVHTWGDRTPRNQS